MEYLKNYETNNFIQSGFTIIANEYLRVTPEQFYYILMVNEQKELSNYFSIFYTDTMRSVLCVIQLNVMKLNKFRNTIKMHIFIKIKCEHFSGIV